MALREEHRKPKYKNIVYCTVAATLRKNLVESTYRVPIFYWLYCRHIHVHAVYTSAVFFDNAVYNSDVMRAADEFSSSAGALSRRARTVHILIIYKREINVILNRNLAVPSVKEESSLANCVRRIAWKLESHYTI